MQVCPGAGFLTDVLAYVAICPHTQTGNWTASTCKSLWVQHLLPDSYFGSLTHLAVVKI